MEYALAKELKDAGFPQGASGIYPEGNKVHDLEILAYLPTLEELIEACGERFHSLVYEPTSPKKWRVVGVGNRFSTWVAEGLRGNTTTEAVANLWLALNKK